MPRAPKLSTVGRSVTEWIGKTPDVAVPDRVKLRIWRRQVAEVGPDSDHAVCPLSKLWLRQGDAMHLDHRRPLADGGEHRESNLDYVHPIAHAAKTAAEAKDRARADAAAKRAIGIKGRSKALAGRDRAGINADKDARAKARGAKEPARSNGGFSGCFRIIDVEPAP